MSTKTAMICTKCKEVLNSEDDIFGTSCGHLYHFLCLRECHGRSTNCSHCESYKPCMFKMFLEFGEAINWKDQTKTIELHNKLEESKQELINLEEKYKYSQVAVQKLEGKLKKHNDALKSKDITMADLEERITTLEELNSVLSAQLEMKTTNNDNTNNIKESVVQNRIKKLQNLSEKSEQEIAKNSKMSIENMKLKAFLNVANNEIGMDAINLAELMFDSNQTENTDQSKENGNHIEEIVSHTETISKPINQCSGFTNTPENSKQSASSSPENTNDSHTVVIRNYLIQDLKNPLESVVIDIASRMDMNLCTSDILRVIKIKKNLKSVSLIVVFKNSESRQKFLKNKNRLKKNKCTKYLEISASTK
ncbi:uncharacterized protein LOC124420562 [Lucilia cuprina]|uniref:uncharacterized protein LOC124420562 n=1 Tax=Lucilia cuprina TaxID=7375 RepID=UPI001F05FB51|nr:uncharacterized protein LOC124420562 [Lucilia cuprina]